MSQRLTKRNANLCVSLSAIWLVFSFLVGAIKNASRGESWFFPIVVWGIQLLLVVVSIYFYKTEKPRLSYWIGDVHGYAYAVVSLNILPEIFHQIALLIPELVETEIKHIIEEMQKSDVRKAITIPIEFYNRSEKIQIYANDNENYSEDFKEGQILLFVSTHVDLANQIQSIFDSYSES